LKNTDAMTSRPS